MIKVNAQDTNSRGDVNLNISSTRSYWFTQEAMASDFEKSIAHSIGYNSHEKVLYKGFRMKERIKEMLEAHNCEPTDAAIDKLEVQTWKDITEDELLGLVEVYIMEGN